MQKIKDYLSNPGTRIAALVFVFGLGMSWASTQSQINALEKEYNELHSVVTSIDIAGIQSQLSSIQTDIQWVKYELQTKH